MRQVVSNTGPLLHLGEARALALLQPTGDVHIPGAVDAEMARHVPDWPAQRPTWITIGGLAAPYAADAVAWHQAGLLDQGEAAAIALAQQIHADWSLTDDAAARIFAQALGLEVHGSLGVVLWAAAAGHLSHTDAETCLDRLAQSSLWVSARVLAEAKAALRRLAAGP